MTLVLTLAAGGVYATTSTGDDELDTINSTARIYHFTQECGLGENITDSDYCNNYDVPTTSLIATDDQVDTAQDLLEDNGFGTRGDQDALTLFVASGTALTQHLGAGERMGVLNSFVALYGKDAPEELTEWEDVLKISAGRWPSVRNLSLEQQAVAKFETVYLRQPDFSNQHDEAAVKVMAYGLRPNERNLNSEQAALEIYVNIFGGTPTESGDWDVVRAIAYSGATR